MGEIAVTKNQKLTLEGFFNQTLGDLEKKIVTTVQNKKIVAILNDGKRLRPFLAHLSFKVCTGGKETPYQYQRALEGAVTIELAHTASLIHDDIMDGDSKRRGRPAFHSSDGISNALLMGHKMLAKGFDIALGHGEKLAKLYVETWSRILSGQMDEVNYNPEDINNGTKGITTKSKIFKAYYKIIDQKTASLFASSCRAGAVEADANGEILDILFVYGREVGLAYQLADDLVDLKNGELIDSVIIPLLTRLENKKVDVNSLNVSEIKKIIKKNESKIRKMYLKEIERHVRKAEKISRSKEIPESQYKILLTEAPSYVINKMLREINVAI
jgi:geranylgeranyl pyrophosphate synthase